MADRAIRGIRSVFCLFAQLPLVASLYNTQDTRKRHFTVDEGIGTRGIAMLVAESRTLAAGQVT